MSEDKRILDFELEILRDADQFLCQQNEKDNYKEKSLSYLYIQYNTFKKQRVGYIYIPARRGLTWGGCKHICIVP